MGVSNAIHCFWEFKRKAIDPTMTGVKIVEAIKIIKKGAGDLYSRIDLRSQQAFIVLASSQLLLTIKSEPELKEYADKFTAISDSLRDLTNKLSTHKTLNPKKLGARETFEVIGDLLNLITLLPKSVLAKLNPQARTAIEGITTLFNTIGLILKANDIRIRVFSKK